MNVEFFTVIQVSVFGKFVIVDNIKVNDEANTYFVSHDSRH